MKVWAKNRKKNQSEVLSHPNSKGLAKPSILLTHLDEREQTDSTQLCVVIQLVHIYINRTNGWCRCQQNIKWSLTYISISVVVGLLGLFPILISNSHN